MGHVAYLRRLPLELGHTNRTARRITLAQVIAAIGLVALAAITVYAAAWVAGGGTCRIVSSPSMGTAAPVGTLLWISRVKFADLRVGDIITFHPPSRAGATYSHRIIARNPDNTLTTRGDINGTPDPWHLSSADIVGKVSARWWDMGWVVRALPILLIGALLLWSLTRWCCSEQWRVPARLTGAGLIVSIAIWRLRLLVRAQVVSFAPAEGGARGTVVNTGVLPIKLTGVAGERDAGRSGQLLSVLLRETDRHGRYTVHVGPDLPWPWVALVCCVVFAPPVYALVVGRVSRAASSV